MSKISLLPEIDTPLTGNEPVVLVHGGRAKQGPIGELVEQLAQPYVEQAAASAAAFDDFEGKLLDDLTTLVQGKAALAPGEATVPAGTWNMMDPAPRGARLEEFHVMVSNSVGTLRLERQVRSPEGVHSRVAGSQSAPLPLVGQPAVNIFDADDFGQFLFPTDEDQYLGYTLTDNNAFRRNVGTSGNVVIGYANTTSPSASYTPVTSASYASIEVRAVYVGQDGAIISKRVVAVEDKANANEAAASALNETLNGTMTGTRMTEASGSNLSVRAFRSIAIPSGDSFRLQFQAKAGERTIMRSFSQNGLAHTVSFNLQTGVATGAGASMRRLHNGWWECIYEGVSTLGNPINWQVQLASATGSWPYNGDGTSGAFLHRARVTNLTAGVVLLDTTAWTSGWTIGSATMTANAALFGGILPENMGAGSSAHALFGKKVAVLGTSLVQQNQWTAAFQSLTGCSLINLGRSGASYGLSSDYTDSRIGEATAQMTTANIPSDTALIIVDMGVNDPFWRVPVGAVSDTTTATFAGAMANVSIWAAANRPAAEVLYTQLTSAEPSYPTHRHGGLASGGLATVAQLEDYQLMLERIARREGRSLIDLNDFGISWRTTGIRSDLLHWNAIGGGLIGQILAQETDRLAVPGWLP